MTTRRLRLSIESLDDRITPASASDLTGLARDTVGTAMFLQALSKDPMALASPALRPAVVSYFTGVYQQATTTLSLIGQFPGTLPGAEEQIVSQLAQIEASVAQSVAARLGFTLFAAAPAPAPAPNAGAASPAQSTVAVAPGSIAVGQTSAITLQAKDANGTNLTAGGATVAFALGTGTAVGTIGTVTDNHNGTYTATFTATTVGSNTITATINGQAVTTTAPTITVTAANTAAPSAAQSTVAASPTSVPVGQTSTVTLTAKDASGTALTTGGATVTFGLGTGPTVGTFGQVTDNNNGTYTATFTAATAGSNTITATINGQAVTSAAPTITVTAGTGAGPASPAQSVVSVTPPSVASGDATTVTLTAKDANGSPLATGGAAVTFALGSPTGGQGTFGTVTDNNNGTYTAVFTGTTAGTNTITATLDGQPVTSAAPTVTVTAAAGPGPADPAQSTVAASPTSVPNGGTSTLTLTAKDASGAALTTGGATVAFGLGTGPTIGTFGTVADNNDGTYTATFTATTVGTNTITATINGQPVTTAAPSVTVTAGSGAADLALSSVALAPTSIASGGSSVVTLTARDSAGNPLTGSTLTVTFALGGGSAAGSFDSVVNNGDGTYTANFTASGAGTNTIIGSIDGAPLTSTAPTMTVT